jgi:hypothetical protein
MKTCLEDLHPAERERYGLNEGMKNLIARSGGNGCVEQTTVWLTGLKQEVWAMVSRTTYGLVPTRCFQANKFVYWTIWFETWPLNLSRRDYEVLMG